jgi:hypothetical protein
MQLSACDDNTKPEYLRPKCLSYYARYLSRRSRNADQPCIYDIMSQTTFRHLLITSNCNINIIIFFTLLMNKPIRPIDNVISFGTNLDYEEATCVRKD